MNTWTFVRVVTQLNRSHIASLAQSTGSLLWSELDWVNSRTSVDRQWYFFFLFLVPISYFFTCFFFSTTVTENPSWIKINMSPNFYYDGDCNDPNVQANITQNFLGLLNSAYVPGIFCTFRPDDCNEDTVEVYCGALTAAERRRKRRSVREVWDLYTYM